MIINQSLEDLKALIFNTQESNQLKIAFIKEELQSRRYLANNAKIATKLMEYTKERIAIAEMA